MQKYTIFGERCSGTNYLLNIMNINFDAEITWEYGWKHFFGFQDEQLQDSDDTLFICIVRNPIDWINSFYREMHHLPLKYNKTLREEVKLDEFLNKEFWSINDEGGNCDISNEMMDDRNIYTGERYKNIFELRHTKIKWLLTDLPNKVKNYILIRYEDLKNDFTNTLLQIKNKGLEFKDHISLPVNTNRYKNTHEIFVEKTNTIESSVIMDNPNLIKTYEKELGYIYTNEE
jgi:hypothetical protein